MKSEPRAQLAEILRRYGTDLVDNPRRLEALLRDLCPDCRLEVNLLVTALREGAVAAMQAASPTLPEAILLAQQAGRLETQAGLSADAARWAVESWAAALGVSLPTAEPAQPASPPTGSPAQPASPPTGQAPTRRAEASADAGAVGQPPDTGQAITLRLTPDEAWSGCRRVLFLGQGAYHVTVPPQTGDGTVLHVPDPVPPWDRQGPARPLTVTIQVALDTDAAQPPSSPAVTGPATTPSPAPWPSPAPLASPGPATGVRHGSRGFNLVIGGLAGLFLLPIIGLPLMIAGGIEAGKAQPGDVDYAQSRSAVGILKWTGGLVAALFLFALVVGFLDAIS